MEDQPIKYNFKDHRIPDSFTVDIIMNAIHVMETMIDTRDIDDATKADTKREFRRFMEIEFVKKGVLWTPSSNTIRDITEADFSSDQSTGLIRADGIYEFWRFMITFKEDLDHIFDPSQLATTLPLARNTKLVTKELFDPFQISCYVTYCGWLSAFILFRIIEFCGKRGWLCLETTIDDEDNLQQKQAIAMSDSLMWNMTWNMIANAEPYNTVISKNSILGPVFHRVDVCIKPIITVGLDRTMRLSDCRFAYVEDHNLISPS